MGHPGDPVEEEEVIVVEEPDRGDRCPARVVKAPRMPTLAEREAHMATHLPHEDWCEICMKGRGRNTPHSRGAEVPAAGDIIVGRWELIV